MYPHIALEAAGFCTAPPVESADDTGAQLCCHIEAVADVGGVTVKSDHVPGVSALANSSVMVPGAQDAGHPHQGMGSQSYGGVI